jgi:hypothetical protein
VATLSPEPVADRPAPTGGVPGTVAAHASTDVPVALTGQLAGDVLAALQGRTYDTVALVAVCSGEVLRGVVRIERLLVAPPGTPVDELMDRQPPTVTPATDQEHAAWRAGRRWPWWTTRAGSSGWSLRSGCSASCSPSTTRTWPASAVSSGPGRLPAPPRRRA